jgi:hypothetical protein
MAGRNPTTLVELFNVLGGTAAAGETQSDILQWVYEFSKHLGLEVRYDEYKKGEYDEELFRRRLAESQAEAKKHFRAAPPPKPKPARTITFDEFQARKAAPPGKASTEQLATAAPKQKARKGRGAPLAMTLDHGRLYVRPDPAIQDPRAPPAVERKAHLEPGAKAETVFAYLDADETLVGRVFIYRDDRHCPRKGVLTPIEHEFRSLTIDAVTWRPLAITPRPFSRGSKAVDVDALIQNGAYEVVVTNDGSLGTIYQWTHPRAGPIWCMATVKGYDVFPYHWSGAQTWAEQLQGLLETTEGAGGKSISELLGTGLKKDFLCPGDMRIDFGELAPGFCYTVGMRHHDTHPLLADPQGVWNVQHIALGYRSAFQPVFRGGIPHFAEQQLYTTMITYSELVEATQNSLEEAIAAIAAGKTGFEHFKYGFILRSRDIGVTGRNSDVLIDSPLLAFIRNKMYARPYSREDREHLTAENRNKYGFLRGALISKDTREQLLGLYPQFKELDHKAQEFLKNVERYVVERSKRAVVSGAPKPKAALAGYSHATECLGDEILTCLRREHPRFSGFERDVASTVIQGYLYHSVTAMFVLEAIGEL